MLPSRLSGATGTVRFVTSPFALEQVDSRSAEMVQTGRSRFGLAFHDIPDARDVEALARKTIQ